MTACNNMRTDSSTSNNGRRPHVQNIININSGNRNCVPNGQNSASHNNCHQPSTSSSTSSSNPSSNDLLNQITALQTKVDEITTNLANTIHSTQVTHTQTNADGTTTTSALNTHLDNLNPLIGAISEGVGANAIKLNEHDISLADHNTKHSDHTISIDSIIVDLNDLSNNVHLELSNLSGDVSSNTAHIIDLSNDIVGIYSLINTISGLEHFDLSSVTDLSGTVDQLSGTVGSLDNSFNILTGK